MYKRQAKNILLGFVVGFVLACAVVVLRTMLDDTYKSADDIRKYTGMVVLALSLIHILPPIIRIELEPKRGKKVHKRSYKRGQNDQRFCESSLML